MDSPFLLAKAMTIPQLKRRRKIWVFLPSDYFVNTNKRYPVVYFNDAQNIFDKNMSAFGQSWEVHHTMRSLAASGYKEAIIIGVEHAKRKRIKEYTPLTRQGHFAEGDAYSNFLANKLKPYVDKKLRTLPDRDNTALVGSSMGGLITFYSGLKHQDVFGKLGVFSPSFWITPTLFGLVEKVGRHYPMKIFLLVGNKEGRSLMHQTDRMYHTLMRSGFPQHEVNLAIRDGKHNEEFWRKEFMGCYQWLMN